jgi:hypothetical protein
MSEIDLIARPVASQPSAYLNENRSVISRGRRELMVSVIAV